MTYSEEVYAVTLNTLGSTPYHDPFVQDIVDQEHALADPKFRDTLEGRRKALLVAAN